MVVAYRQIDTQHLDESTKRAELYKIIVLQALMECWTQAAIN